MGLGRAIACERRRKCCILWCTYRASQDSARLVRNMFLGLLNLLLIIGAGRILQMTSASWCATRSST